MWCGKKKAITFSFDDGVLQDQRAIEILNEFNLKATFNLNSELLGKPNKLSSGGVSVNHTKISPDRIKDVYFGHEIAVHTLTHPLLTNCADEEIIRQVEEDRKALESLCGYKVCGMAYPGGGVNHDERVVQVVKEKTNMQYARTITSTHSFDLQENLFEFNPTVYYIEDCLFDLANKFLELNVDKPQLLYIWGHTYEMDWGNHIDWEKFRKFCKFISGHEEIFYGTNKQVLLNE